MWYSNATKYSNSIKKFYLLYYKMTSEIKSNWLTKQLDKIFDDKCLFSKSGTQQRGPGFLCGLYIVLIIVSLVFNIVMTESMDFVELQGSGEEASFTNDEMESMLGLGKKGVSEIIELQKQAVLEAKGDMENDAAKKLADHFNR